MLSLLLLAAQAPAAPDSILIGDHPKEKRLRNVRQLTFGGQNAEAYWNLDGSQIVYQSRQPEWPDEQILAMNADGSGKRLVSTGLGRCTCGYFSPDGKWIYFSSTHEKDPGAQKPLDFSKGYVWMVNPKFSLYRVPAVGEKGGPNPLQKLIDKGAYVAETTIAPNGKFLVFTSNFEGDLEIYRANLDGTGIRNVGYDGGPFVSWDSKKIVYRRYDLKSQAEVQDYRSLLAEHLVRPGKLEVYIMDADGRNNRKVTDLGCGSFAPFLHPDGQRILFTSNFGDKRGREFELWMINVDGTGLERVTYSPEFDGFPMFTRDGKRLVWSSNRNGKVRGETNVFVADWVEK
jgi:TolB protein